MKTSRSGYTSIPGSAGVPRGAAEKPKQITVLHDFVAVPLDLFDRVALDQEPEEFALYLHLWRLAEGLDRCRVSRAELERRLRISQLRLGKALAGLVEKGHVALLDRNREGTLYRLVAGVPGRGEAPGPRVAPATPRAVEAGPSPAPVRAPGPSPAPPPVPTPAALGALARGFLDKSGGGRGRSPDEVLEELLGLAEEGHGLDAIAAALERFRREAPRKTPIAELSRYLVSSGV